MHYHYKTYQLKKLQTQKMICPSSHLREIKPLMPRATDLSLYAF